MNDRYKFRVWDKLDEEYYDENCFQMQIESSGDLFIIGVGNDGEDCFWETDNTVIEQCTGLKDKNGKLIYEGDIILVEDNKCPIEWESENARYNVIGYGELAYLNYNDIEVIGNIHENADLLGKNND